MTSLIHLTAIANMRYDELRKERIKHVLEWNIKGKCECVKKIENPNEENFIACLHSEADFIKKNYKKIKKNFNEAILLGKLDGVTGKRAIVWGLT